MRRKTIEINIILRHMISSIIDWFMILYEDLIAAMNCQTSQHKYAEISNKKYFEYFRQTVFILCRTIIVTTVTSC